MSSTASTIISRPGRRAASLALAVAALAYPLLVYAGLRTLPALVLGLVLLGVIAARIALTPAGPLGTALVAGAIALVALLLLDPAIALRAWPVLLSLALAAVFAWSLRHPPSAIERLARIAEPELPPAGVVYTRKVTVVWLCFFVANATVAAWTALFTSLETWTLYNGLVSYVIIGVIFAIEWTVRQRVRRRAA